MSNNTRKNSSFETILFVFVTIFLTVVLVGNFIYGTNTARVYIFIIVGIVIWFILGCAVLAGIDRNQELYEWVWDKAPNGLFSMLAIFLFPIVAIAYIYRKRK
jgi:nitrate reductase NapE component